MAEVELIMPKMGESIMEATILKWLKNVGDSVEADESILEIATDKVDSEVPSPVAGVIAKTLFGEGDTIEVGKAIAIINTDGDATTPTDGSTPAKASQPAEPTPQTAPPQPPPQAQPQPASEPVVTSPQPPVTPQDRPRSNGEGRFYSPLVLNIARRESIAMTELETIPGTGKNNRVTKRDILNYVQNRGAQPVQEQPVVTPAPHTQTSPPAPKPEPQQQGVPPPSVSATVSGQDEVIEMDRMRKLIAQHMIMSTQTSAHVTSFVEADVTNLVNWRNKVKDEFLQREGEKMTFTPLFMEAVISAIKDYPMINSSVDGETIIKKRNINIGMAAALPTGNLIVPVIKNADQLNLIGLSAQVNDLANRARNNQLRPDEIEGGTFTLTNVGTFGNLMGTPIIFQPQVAILATGIIKKKPVVIETPQGDMIGIRQMMFLSLSYDHRVIDGALGGAFVRKVADYLEQFDVERNI